MLKDIAQAWIELGYPELTQATYDLTSDDPLVRDQADEVFHISDVILDRRFKVIFNYVKLLCYLFFTYDYEQERNLQLLEQISHPDNEWTQEQKDEFQDFIANYINEFKKCLLIDEYKYRVCSIFSALTRYRDVVAPLILSLDDGENGIYGALSSLMIKPLSNINIYINYFKQKAQSENAYVRQVAEKTLKKLLE